MVTQDDALRSNLKIKRIILRSHKHCVLFFNLTRLHTNFNTVTKVWQRIILIFTHWTFKRKFFLIFFPFVVHEGLLLLKTTAPMSCRCGCKAQIGATVVWSCQCVVLCVFIPVCVCVCLWSVPLQRFLYVLWGSHTLRHRSVMQEVWRHAVPGYCVQNCFPWWSMAAVLILLQCTVLPW